ncbi:hypothetical protein HNP73_000267 [Amaricoccus macauensis]|uniref:Excalibur calcium-binding domain-containing protein n=1 Tax=Amaricoccus macauensis TaxID=57001 RepID=A0A840SKD4_9RHOB|nr:hypothetical protein [Amaricoccus macauensis]
MRRHLSAGALALAMLTLPAASHAVQTSEDAAGADIGRRLMEIAQGHSCSPKLTCGRISSCEEAHWLLANCSWGGKLDRNGDGVPCESLC